MYRGHVAWLTVSLLFYSDLLDKAIRSIAERDIDSLFTSSKTTALVNAIAGLDDFELIGFLVIQNDRKI